MDHFSYTPSPMVCSSRIEVSVEDGIIRDVKFSGGCNGNLQGVAKLAKDRPVKEVIALLNGIRCGGKPTSCPDQFTKALQTYLEKKGNV